MEGANLQKQETLGKYSSIGRATISGEKSTFAATDRLNELPATALTVEEDRYP